MQNSEKNKSRKKKDSNLVVFLAVICVAVSVAAGIAVGVLLQQKQAIVRLTEENSALKQELEELQGALAEGQGSLAGSEEASSEGESLPEEESGQEETAKTETAEPETTEPEETEPPYLTSLSGLAAGTILSKEQIDFSNLDAYFMAWEIEEGDNLYQRMNGKSYQKNDYVPLESLRYIKMPHYNFEGQIQVGEMVVSRDILEDVFAIFKELFEAEYQIQSMYLVDNYWTGDPDTTDSASIDVNNTSAFCFRMATGSQKLSNHAYGKAIDLNPQQNPYVSYSSGKPKWSHTNANDYIDRSTGLPHVITHEDLAYQVFTRHGFRWGGDWNNPKDYQHFDKN